MEKEIKQWERISLLMANKLVGTLTGAEEEELNRWRDESLENSLLYDQWIEQKDAGKGYHQFFARDYHPYQVALQRHIRTRRNAQRYRIGVGWAAAVLLLIGLSWFIRFQIKSGQPTPPVAYTLYEPNKVKLTIAGGESYLLTENQPIPVEADALALGKITNTGKTLVYDSIPESQPIEWHTIEVPPGAEYNLLLADGTHVYLNSGTTLTYPSHFGGENREVMLSGEAYFEVTRNVSKEFIVTMDNFRVKVLGTSFNINSYKQNEVATTTLEEGQIQVVQGEYTFDLIPGNQLIINQSTGESSLKTVDTELYTSWRKGYYRFENTSLDEIMNTLAIWYNVEISYQNPQAEKITFSGRVRRYDNIRVVLDGFRETNKIEYKIDGNKIIIQ